MQIYKSEDIMLPSQAVGIQECKCTAELPEGPHKHEFIELVYILSGEGTHYINDTPYRVSRGNLLFINYNEVHSFSAETEMRYVNFYVKPEFISENLADSETIYDIFAFLILDKYFDDRVCLPVAEFSGRDMLDVEEMIAKMLDEIQKKRAGYTVVLDGYLRIIFAKMIRCLVGTQPNTDCRRAITPELIEYIDENYNKPITLSSLANRCFYNPAYLGRMFRNELGIGLREYICEKRLAHATTLLTETDNTVEAVAEMVGYTDKKQFYRVFKEHLGCTPNEFRIKNTKIVKTTGNKS